MSLLRRRCSHHRPGANPLPRKLLKHIGRLLRLTLTCRCSATFQSARTGQKSSRCHFSRRRTARDKVAEGHEMLCQIEQLHNGTGNNTSSKLWLCVLSRRQFFGLASSRGREQMLPALPSQVETYSDAPPITLGRRVRKS